MSQQETGRRDPVGAWNHVRAVLLLPFMNTVLIPSVALWLARDIGALRSALPDVATVILGILGAVVVAGGSTLVIRAIGLFVVRGKGTLAPWDPTEVLITEDIYRYSRNPMKAGLFLVLIGECLLTLSPALMVWTVCFITANIGYIRLVEERGLRKRFGAAYDEYRNSVPRWFGLPGVRRRRALTMRSAS
jgi:protein-S-isoprenylcysteine O-methyltransferase Ste14